MQLRCAGRPRIRVYQGLIEANLCAGGELSVGKIGMKFVERPAHPLLEWKGPGRRRIEDGLGLFGGWVRLGFRLDGDRDF